MTLPSGRVVDYSRDGLRRIKAIDTTFNGSAQNIISNIQYRGDNQVLSYAYANGLSATRSYDLQGRLQSQQLQDTSNTVIDQRSYSYDKNSNLTNIDTNIEDNAYLYDKRDRLTRDTIDSNSPFDFTYDQNDNRLTKQRQDLSLNEFFEQQEKSNRLSVVAAVKPGLTPIEDLPNRDMVYNDVGRLYQLIEAGTLKAEYLYNDSGQRTRKTVYQGDGISIDSITIYHYDQQGYLITETTETGALIKDYIWQQGLHPVAQIDASMPAQAGMPSEGIIYLHTDHLLTNRLATDATRKVIWRWEGEAFGNTPASGSVSVNLRFPGQYYDAETNLHYNHFRYYDPELGRYITSDPIGLGSGTNTYAYVGMNPLTYTDHTGLYWPTVLPDNCWIVINSRTFDNNIEIKKGTPEVISERIITGTGGRARLPGMTITFAAYLVETIWQKVDIYDITTIEKIAFYIRCIEYDECGNVSFELTPGYHENSTTESSEHVQKWTKRKLEGIDRMNKTNRK